MLFLAELIAGKFGEAHASEGCTRDRLYEMAQVKVSSAPRAPASSPRATLTTVARPPAAPPRAGAIKGARARRPGAARVGLDRHP
jgi:hypothetical protein